VRECDHTELVLEDLLGNASRKLSKAQRKSRSTVLKSEIRIAIVDTSKTTGIFIIITTLTKIRVNANTTATSTTSSIGVIFILRLVSISSITIPHCQKQQRR
jgi:hypothetical protein